MYLEEGFLDEGIFVAADGGGRGEKKYVKQEFVGDFACAAEHFGKAVA